MTRRTARSRAGQTLALMNSISPTNGPLLDRCSLRCALRPLDKVRRARALLVSIVGLIGIASAR